jgi:hypothetical protein
LLSQVTRGACETLAVLRLRRTNDNIHRRTIVAGTPATSTAPAPGGA